jgi:hypothetical protein
MAQFAQQKVELRVKGTFLVFAKGTEDEDAHGVDNEAIAEGAFRRRSLSDDVVQYGEYDDGTASLETSSPPDGSEATDTDGDEPGTSSQSMLSNQVNTHGNDDGINSTAVPIYYCIPVPVVPVICWQEQSGMVDDLQQQVLTDSQAGASRLDIAAQDLKIKAQEAEEIAQHLRSKAKDLRSSTSAVAENGLDRSIMNLKARAQEAAASALLLRARAKDMRLQRAELDSATELEREALQLRKQAQEAEDGARLVRAKARAPWRQQWTSGSNEIAPLVDVHPASSLEQPEPSSHLRGETDPSSVEPTTLMLRNIPNGYTRDMLLQLLDGEGFQGLYDLLFVPWDFNRLAGLGYAFVNFTSNDNAAKAMQHFQGFGNWLVESQKRCEVVWGAPLQGLDAHVEHYRNTPVMHKSVPECYKPALFKDGQRQPFPGPTKSLRAPRMRRGGIPSK